MENFKQVSCKFCFVRVLELTFLTLQKVILPLQLHVPIFLCFYKPVFKLHFAGYRTRINRKVAGAVMPLKGRGVVLLPPIN